MYQKDFLFEIGNGSCPEEMFAHLYGTCTLSQDVFFSFASAIEYVMRQATSKIEQQITLLAVRAAETAIIRERSQCTWSLMYINCSLA